MSQRRDEASWPTRDGKPPRALSDALESARSEDGTSAQVALLEASLARQLGVASLAELDGPHLPAAALGSKVGKAALLKFGVLVTVGAIGLWAWNPWAPEQKPSPVQNASERPSATSPASLPAPLVVAEPPSAAPSPASPAPALAKVRPAHVGKATASKTQADDSLAREAALMTRAHAQLATRPAEALDTAGEHLRLYPHGILAQERERVAITALQTLGRDEEALARTRALERTFPSSPYLSSPKQSPQLHDQAGEQRRD